MTAPEQAATPRTDAAADFTAPEKLFYLARDMERELAQATTQRDALRAALQAIVDPDTPPDSPIASYAIKRYRAIAHAALANGGK